MTGVLIRRRDAETGKDGRKIPCEGPLTQREDCHVKIEAEITMMQLQAKELQSYWIKGPSS